MFLQFPHFNSTIPDVGVTLSITRHPQIGHLLETRIPSFFFSTNIVISHYNIKNLVRVPQMLFSEETKSHHSDTECLF